MADVERLLSENTEATLVEATAQGKAINLCKMIVQSLEQILLKINSNELDSLDNLTGIVTLMDDLLQCNISEDSSPDVNYERIVELFYQLIVWQFVCDNRMHALHQLLSLLVSWTDKRQDFRSLLTRTGFLLHHCLHLRLLQQYKEITPGVMVIAQLSIAILTNCALEIDHNVYLDQVEWGEVLSHWLSCGKEGIQIHAKFLCGFLAPAIGHSRYDLFSMSQTEIDGVVRILGAASNSPTMIAAGWRMQFSALELVQNMIYLCFYPPNLTAFANADLMPAMVTLLIRQDLSLFRAVVHLIWILLGDESFQSHSDPFMDDILEMCSNFSSDDYDRELQFLAHLLEFTLTSEENRKLSGFAVFYFLPIKDWYFLSITTFGIDLDTIMPLTKIGSESNKRIIFTVMVTAIGSQALDHKVLWHIFTEKCSTYQELEQKFKIMHSVKKAGDATDVDVGLSTGDNRQVAKDYIPAKPTFQEPDVQKKDSFSHTYTDIAVARKQMSKGMNLLYSLCLKYKILLSDFSRCLSQWSSLWHYLSLSQKFISDKMVKCVIDGLMESNLTLNAVYELLSKLNRTVKARDTVKEPTILLLRITDLLCTWVLASRTACHYLATSGLLLNHCQYLLKWNRESGTKFADFLLQKNMLILLNCCWEKEFQYYANAFSWLSLLPKLYSSDDSLIQIATIFIGANLSFALPDSIEYLWKLQKEQVIFILELFKKTYFKETSDKEFKITDILLGLQRLIEAHSNNLNTIMVEVWMLLNWAVEVLANGTMIERENMAILVCMLLRSPTAKETLLTSNDCFFLHNIHKAAYAISNNPLRGLLNCIVCTTKDQAQLDCNDYKECCENSYTYGLFSECINWCQKLESARGADDPKQFMKFKVYKAKALFHLYKREQMKIKANELRIGKEFTALHKQCYNKTKEIISILGRALDDGCLDGDSEGLYMLDISMMDYIHATNKLNDLKRCYLCLKRLYIPQSATTGGVSKVKAEVSQHATDESEATCGESKCKSDRHIAAKQRGKSNLIHSHLIPKSILDRFTQALPAPKHLKIFVASHTGTLLEVDKGKVYAPKPFGRDMCCSNCEDILSSKGESSFMKKFFDKIYNPAEPQSPKQEHFIDYGPWLYHFCAGLIFRNILLPPFTFLNEKEVYNLLFLFRKCVLNLEAMEDKECPEIYVLNTPLSVEGDELKHGRLNYVLTATLEWHLGRYNLTSGEPDVNSPLNAHFFLIHIGMFNVLVKLSPSASCQIPECFRVNSKGGLHHVLAEENRRKFIPLGVWKLFHDEAMECEKLLVEKGNTVAKITPEMDQNDKMKMFQIMSGAFKELSFLLPEVQPSPSPASPKIYNLLPSGFQILQYSDLEDYIFTLPQGHLSIIHKRFMINDGTEETIFVCIGQNGGFELTKPYIIWHNFRPGLEVSIGFFINPHDLSLTEAVGDSKALQNPAKTSLLATKEKIAAVLPRLLLDRGILKLESVIKRISLLREFPNIDQMCCTSGCWYCSQRCHNCFKVLGYRENSSEIQTCSESCRSILCDVPSDLHIVICRPDETPPENFQQRCSPLEKSHQEFFHAYASGVSSNGLAYQSEYAVCSGRQSGNAEYSSELYVVLFTRNRQQQLVIEFFIDEDLSPSSVLPHAEGDTATLTAVDALKKAGAVQKTLSAAFGYLTFEVKLLLAEEMSKLKSATVTG